MSPRSSRPADGVAWVTGASSGIGRALALHLAREGWTVHATARSAEALAALAAESGGRIVAAPGDVTDPAAMAALVAGIEARAPIALAVLNAGIYLPVRGEALDRDDFARTFAVNLDGTVNALLPLLDAMKPRRAGQVAIVSSVTGYGGLPTSAAYGASKAALINLAESLKFDLDRLGIRIQVVNPGFVETPATAQNAFPMPALMKVDEAAARIVRGLAGSGFEITFPRRFTYVLKALGLLPYRLYFPLVARITGWR